MHESISYSFLLNIVILFVFVCGAIISGIFSYYRAFRANTIIVSEIEKFEGYNCSSRESIAKKLSAISYNVPFNVKCKSSDVNCMTDDEENGNYAVVSYNLDFNDGDYAFAFTDKDKENDEFYKMNSKVSSVDNSATRLYQYGVYTYMYVDLPVVSQLLKLSFFSKTKILYEFRDLRSTTLTTYVSEEDYESEENLTIPQNKTKQGSVDYNFIPSDIVESDIDKKEYNIVFANRGQQNYTNKLNKKGYAYGYDPSLGWGDGEKLYDEYNLRDAFRYYFVTSNSNYQAMLGQGRLYCGGYKIDWSVF